MNMIRRVARYLFCVFAGMFFILELFAGNVCGEEGQVPGINVFVKIRGNTGLEADIKKIMNEEFLSKPNIVMAQDSDNSHIYIDLTLVEQKPIKFYGLGVAISYHVRGDQYSYPVSDVAQFGRERMREVCAYLVKEIDSSYCEPLR
ncbi:MAG: hypothetical protein PHH49_08195, partial [Candidatus Omnitrophica bacterium]|nr:hypothetical protein [Candidatus Omnitrophota bacterium]